MEEKKEEYWDQLVETRFAYEFISIYHEFYNSRLGRGKRIKVFLTALSIVLGCASIVTSVVFGKFEFLWGLVPTASPIIIGIINATKPNLSRNVRRVDTLYYYIQDLQILYTDIMHDWYKIDDGKITDENVIGDLTHSYRKKLIKCKKEYLLKADLIASDTIKLLANYNTLLYFTANFGDGIFLRNHSDLLSNLHSDFSGSKLPFITRFPRPDYRGGDIRYSWYIIEALEGELRLGEWVWKYMDLANGGPWYATKREPRRKLLSINNEFEMYEWRYWLFMKRYICTLLYGKGRRALYVGIIKYKILEYRL
ncbi:MAG: hypothetical protein LBR54_03125 [Oscillospiraceae bacterium]|jgi:hypothetical protein|nr:hypothetical protein [Oscillospiraceae bacterium]